MTRSRKPLSPESQGLLDAERDIPATPATTRARAIARARAALNANAWVRPVPAFSGRVSRRPRWAAAAVLVCVGSAALAATTYGIRAYLKPAPGPVPGAQPTETAAPSRHRSRPTVSVVEDNAQDDQASAEATAETSSGVGAGASADVGSNDSDPARTPRSHGGSATDAMRNELRLLRRARAAVAREDFGAALLPIAEHTRRYRHGRLAEEREALRVKSLVGLGRTDEARRAAGSFRARFPHSVLLPAVSQMPASPP